MKFSEIIGHERQTAALWRSWQADRMHHAYLFVGIEGIGKRLVGLALAAAVNCENPDEQGACGLCGPCRKLASGNFPDLIHVPPLETEEQTEDTARSRKRKLIKIEHVRQLQSTICFAPYEGKRRVILIDDAHTLGEAAANALLKMLEEPRPHTMFVLVTSVPMAVLPTIHSRCQSVHFGALSDAQVASIIMNAQDLAEPTARLVAGLAEGSPGRALSADVNFLTERRRELLAGLAGLAGQGAAALFSFADEILSLEMDLTEALGLIRSFYRDVSVWQATGQADRIIHTDLLPEIARTAAEVKPLDLRLRLKAISRIEARQSNNQNRQYAVEGLTLELADASLLANL